VYQAVKKAVIIPNRQPTKAVIMILVTSLLENEEPAGIGVGVCARTKMSQTKITIAKEHRR
jgi:hypothetical protein